MAGGGLLELKRRIKSVANTQKITKAMGLVATAKFKKVRERAEKTTPYYLKFHESINALASSPDVASSKYFNINASETDVYVIVSSNTGLCGSYNTNVFNEAAAQMEGKKVKLVTVGEKAKSHYSRRGYEILHDFTGFGDVISYKDAIEALRPAVELFEKGGARNVYLIYTKFYNPVKIQVETIRVLPFESTTEKHEERLFEPSPKEVFDYVLPKYLNTLMYFATVNSIACEITSRMNAMDNATKNASDILDALKLKYNRARQGNITQEITEIVGGAEALKG